MPNYNSKQALEQLDIEILAKLMEITQVALNDASVIKNVSDILNMKPEEVLVYSNLVEEINRSFGSNLHTKGQSDIDNKVLGYELLKPMYEGRILNDGKQ